jgi:hypothetical protein
MIQPKIQEVYVPATVIDKLGHDYLGYARKMVFPEILVTFTPEEFEQFKREFGKDTLKELFDWCEYRQEKSANSSKAAWNMIIDKLKELL